MKSLTINTSTGEFSYVPPSKPLMFPYKVVSFAKIVNRQEQKNMQRKLRTGNKII